MFPTNSERLIGVSAFVYGYPSSCPRAQCTPNKSVTTLRYTRRHGPVYTVHACRHLPSAVPWISEDRLLPCTFSCPGFPKIVYCHALFLVSICRLMVLIVSQPTRPVRGRLIPLTASGVIACTLLFLVLICRLYVR